MTNGHVASKRLPANRPTQCIARYVVGWFYVYTAYL